EPGQPVRQQLVCVGLVPGVPDDVIGGAVEEPVEHDGELDHAERAAQVATRVRDRADDDLTDLLAQRRELIGGERLEVRGAPEGGKDGHDGAILAVPAGSRQDGSSGRSSSTASRPPAPSTRRWTRSSACPRSRAQWAWSATPRSYSSMLDSRGRPPAS